jgi:hypothetical protein
VGEALQRLIVLSTTPAETASAPAAAAVQIKAAGERVLVIGHSNTVPTIIPALGGPSNVLINPNEIDRMFVLHLPAQGAASLLTMRYGA